MFNGGIRGRRAKDGQGTISAPVQFVQQQDPAPSITGYSISGSDDTQLDPAGGQTVIINGYGFKSGLTGILGSTSISAVTVISATRVSFTSTAQSPGSYTLTLANSNGQAAILVPGLTYSSIPTFTTAAGSIGTTYETKSINTSVTATSDSAITYTLASGSLPTGASLASNGTITGTSPVETGSTTYSFAITATDAELQDVTRSFTLTVNTDVVTWVTPSNGATISLDGSAYSQALSATDAAGYSVSYTANALPTGLTLSTGTISGTPSSEGSTTTLLTATAATTGRSATNTVTWVVSLGDTYWKNVSLLLSGSTPTTTFINDASLNNIQLTIAGDTKPNLFNPYQNGYYSNYFDGSGDYIQIAASATALDLGAGNFTIEFWLYVPGSWTAGGGALMGKKLSDNTLGWQVYRDGNNSSKMNFRFGSQNNLFSGSTPASNVWEHWACVRIGTDIKLYKNGILDATTNNGVDISDPTGAFNIGYADTWVVYGNYYFSNVRIVKGLGVYTGDFTVPTGPLSATQLANPFGGSNTSAITNQTSLLTCQSYRFIDNSTNNFAITKNGDTTLSPAQPFATPTTAAYNTRYSTYFDGTGDYLSLANNTAFDFGSGDLTVECWFMLMGDSAANPVGNKVATLITTLPDIAPLSNDYSLGIGGDTSITGINVGFNARQSGTNQSVTYTATITKGVWHHLAATKTGNTATLYYDGSQVAQNTSFTNQVNSNGTGMKIGTGNFGTYIQPFNGYISNARIVKGFVLYTGSTYTVPTAPLTAVSGTSLLTCQDSTLKDNSTNAFTITSAADAKPVAVSPFTMTTSNTTVTSLGSAYFDGTGDYLNAGSGPQFNLSGDFTIECWVYGSAANWAGGDASGYTMIVDTRNQSNTTEATRLAIGIDNSTSYPYFFNGTGVSATSSITVSVGRWNHIAFSRSGTTLKLFINGVQGASVTESTSFTTSRWCIGSGAATGGTTNNRFGLIGYVADFRLIKGTAVYTSNFLPPQTPLTPVTNTQLLTLQYNGGATNNGFVDQSSFNNIITRNGNVTQGTFSPFSQTGWSTYFNGSTVVGPSAHNVYAGSNEDFTFECWFLLTSSNAVNNMLMGWNNGSFDYIDINANGYNLNMGNSYSVTANTPTWIFGKWYHFAVSRTSGTVRVYVDGTLSFSGSNSNSFGNGSVAFKLGDWYTSPSYAFPGYISNARWVKGTGLYPSTCTPSTTPLTAVANTTLLTAQSNRHIDNSPNNYSLTSGTTTIQAYSPFGGVTSVPTSYSNYFDGTGDQLQFNVSTTPFTFGTGDFTMECWVNMPETTSAKYLIMLGPIANAAPLLYFRNNPYNFYLYYANGYRGNTTSTILPNTWYHVAVSRTSGTLKIFLNGVAEYSATDTTNFTSSAGYPYISGNAAAGNIMTGLISNVRIVKGTGLYTSNFTPSTSPLTTTSQGATASQVSLLTCQSATLVDNSLNNFTPTVTGEVTPRPFNPFGTTITTNVSYTPSVNGGSMYFDGTGDYLTLPLNNIFAIGTSDFTLEMWVYPTSANIPWSTLFAGVNFGNSSDWGLYAGDGTTALYPMFFFTSGSTPGSGTSQTQGSTSITGYTKLTQNSWNHVAVSRSSGTGRLFLNGIQTGTSVSASTWSLENTLQKAVAGGYNGNASSLFTGNISGLKLTSGVGIYTSNFYPGSAPATPTTTIGTTTYSSTLLLNGTSGGIIDYHGTNNLETVGNTQLVSEDPYSGSYYSNYFDGSGDYLTVPDNAALQLASGDFTIEFWINYNSIAGYQTPYSKGYTATGDILLQTGSGNGAIVVYLSGSAVITESTGVNIGQWYHYALVRSGTTVTLYRGGVSRGTATSSANFNTTNQLAIGATGKAPGGGAIGDYPINGYMSNVRVVKGTAVYNTSFTPSTAPLTSISGTSLLTCQSNKFKDNSTNNFTITVNGDTKVKSMNPFQQNTGKSLYFDGSSGKLVIPASPQWILGTSDFTIEFWMYTADTAAGIITPATTGAGYWAILINASNLYWQSAYNGSNLKYAALSGYNNNQWVYVSIIRSSGTMNFYFNGVVQGSGTADTTNYSGAANTLTIGYDLAGNGYYSGYIKDLRITKGVARANAVPTTPLQTK